MLPYTCLQVSVMSAERMQKEGRKPGDRALSKKGKEKGKETKEVSFQQQTHDVHEFSDFARE